MPFRHTPHCIVPVGDSHKYSANLMRDYYGNKLIKSTQMFHLGITHNNVQQIILTISLNSTSIVAKDKVIADLK
jgi:uncharacterized membrane protein SpoIIM required for sporulation